MDNLPHRLRKGFSGLGLNTNRRPMNYVRCSLYFKSVWEKVSATVSVYLKWLFLLPFCTISICNPFNLLPFKHLGSVRFLNVIIKSLMLIKATFI